MKYLILPDVHNRWEKVEKIIKSVKPDKTIFLGDYFDDFGDNPHIIADVADWFHHSVNQKDRVHVCGNHDLHYWFKDNKNMRCSGYEQFKSVTINDFVTKQDWEKLKFFYILDNRWLLSHAGVHPSWIESSKFKPNVISEYSLRAINRRLIGESAEAKKLFYANSMHWFAMPGFSRSSCPYYGGITWCDWNNEFHPIRGIHQIVGHTPDFKLTWHIVDENESSFKTLSLEEVSNPILTDKNSYNLCLDFHPGSKYYAIYENKQLTIHEADDIHEKI
jgi:hypothetical protein